MPLGGFREDLGWLELKTWHNATHISLWHVLVQCRLACHTQAYVTTGTWLNTHYDSNNDRSIPAIYATHVITSWPIRLTIALRPRCCHILQGCSVYIKLLPSIRPDTPWGLRTDVDGCRWLVEVIPILTRQNTQRTLVQPALTYQGTMEGWFHVRTFIG